MLMFQINQDQQRPKWFKLYSFLTDTDNLSFSSFLNPDSHVKSPQWSSSLQGTMKQLEGGGGLDWAAEVLLLVLSCPLWSSWNFGICWNGGELAYFGLSLPLTTVRILRLFLWILHLGGGISRAQTRREQQMVCVQELRVKPSQRHVSFFCSSRPSIAIYSTDVL